VRHERDQLLEENQHLHERVETLARQLDCTKKELKAMTKVQLELQVHAFCCWVGAGPCLTCWLVIAGTAA
jgi:hypothetical protein